MKRGLLPLVTVGLAAAGAFSATVVAGPRGLMSTTIATTATEPSGPVAPGVKIGGIDVGNLTPDQATSAVQTAFETPLLLLVDRHRLALAPETVGASADVAGAVAQAETAAPGTSIPLAVQVKRPAVRAYVTLVARRFDRKAVDSQLSLRHLRPYLTPERGALVLERTRAVQAIVVSLLANRRNPLRLVQKATSPAVTRKNFGPVIVIRRGSNRLFLYNGMRFWSVFPIATGQSIYPTPLGRWTIVVKWRNPWWYPPASPWAQGLKPVPPGPGNPLGTRWMGLSAPGVGIHGTPDAASIGYSASHGCIRMRIPDAEWLFNRVRIGTTVFIVAA
ncbi:MAG: L,D-transpeptidase [Gaiellaceae bacterium]